MAGCSPVPMGMGHVILAILSITRALQLSLRVAEKTIPYKAQTGGKDDSEGRRDPQNDGKGYAYPWYRAETKC